jgi:hypothetical protein
MAAACGLAVDPRDDLARRVGRALQRRRVGVGHGERVQRRVHVARIDGDDGDAVRPSSSSQIRLRCASAALLAPYAPQPAYGVTAASLETLSTTRGARGGAFARRAGEQAEQRLGEAERPEEVGGERRLEVLALGVGEQRERHRAEARRVVDEHVEAAERGADLERDRMRVFLAGDVADDAVAAGDAARDLATASAWRATKATASPRAANASTSARPRPEVPPVTATRSGGRGMTGCS